MSSPLSAPFRFDIVGSFLRPESIKHAREEHAAGTLDDAQLTAIENDAITDLVAKQKAAGLQVITDGEFRRSYWHLDFMWGFEGIERSDAREGYKFHDEETTADTAVVTDPIFGDNHPFVKHFKFVQAFADDTHVARQTLPAPIQTFIELTLDRVDGQHDKLRAVYATNEELADALTEAYRTVVADLYAAGCRNIQFDDCSWGRYCDKDYIDKSGIQPQDLRSTCELGVALNNAVFEGQPDDLVVTTHVCRGNYHSTYAYDGGYGPVAPYLFGQEAADAFYLEFDTPRAGGFEPLSHIAQGKKVVLGLVSTKYPELEDEDALIARIHEAAQWVPLEQLYLSPQCGFASCEIGNKLTEAQQWAKIALVKRVAGQVWNDA